MAVEGKLVGLYDVFTAPASRRQGLAHQLCAHLMQIAATQGATATYLQVESNNLTAQSVYRKLGFTDAYSYHYRKPPPPAEPG